MRNLHWRIIESKYVFKDRWFIARADKCAMPDGKIIEPYYVLEFPNWCNVVVVTEDEKLVMVRQYRHAIQETIIELPGGVIDAGETPEQSAIREIAEETGYAVDSVELLYSADPNPATNDNHAWFFLARNAKPIAQQKFDDAEDMDVMLYSKEEAKRLLMENKIQHGMQVGALYAAMIKLGWLDWK
ncbi:MAG: NUDIX hydrolase [Chitinophagaceae bacterium]|nr:NUDIX hydrolase [Chitinophagaceae bacterium]